MKIADFAKKMDMEVLCGGKGLGEEIGGLYIGDLLSRVMSMAGEGVGWITVHTGLNTIAVAHMADIKCIILPEGIRAEEKSMERAIRENIVILSSPMGAYEIAWRAHEILR